MAIDAADGALNTAIRVRGFLAPRGTGVNSILTLLLAAAGG
jgi:hypothetical protein